jgi:hypothetical protein
LLQDPAALLYVTMVLAQRIDAANRGFLELKSQLEAGEPQSLIDKTLDGIEGLLSAIGAGYIRAGAGYTMYPFAQVWRPTFWCARSMRCMRVASTRFALLRLPMRAGEAVRWQSEACVPTTTYVTLALARSLEAA